MTATARITKSLSRCTEQYIGGKSAKLRNSHIKAEIRAIDKLKLSNEVRKQKLEEGQYLAELVLDAEVQIGKLTAAIPKAKNQYDAIRNGADSTKSEALKEIGIKQDTAERYERLACYLPFDIIIVYLLRIMNNNAAYSSDRNIADDYNADVIVLCSLR